MTPDTSVNRSANGGSRLAPGYLERWASQATTVKPRSFSCPRNGRQGSIPCYEWSPEHAHRATVLVVHGLGDHGQALPYFHLASALAPIGYRVLTFDQRGHGPVGLHERSSARLGDLLSDLDDVAGLCRTRWPADALAIVGISMGAIVALMACQRTPGLADGVAAVSAPLGPVAASPVAILAARILGRVLPGLPLPSGIDVSQVAADQEAVRIYTADPLFHSTVRAGLASDLLSAPHIIRSGAGSFRLPILMLHGQADQIAPWDPHFPSMVSRQLLTVRTIPNGRHNLFLDSVSETVFSALDSWLQGIEQRRSDASNA